jgi:NAD(P)H-dependent FMN reductase
MICSPEYAHGVPGSLKNGLDWLVSGVELMDMPVALINASQYSTYAFPALQEIIRTMGGRIVPEACATLQLAGKPNEAELMTDSAIRDQLQRAWAALVASVDTAHLE